jgi:hypothetical protein
LRRLELALAALPLALAACTPTGPLAGVDVRTDRSSYAPGAPLVVEITNHSDWDAWFVHCDHRPHGLERRGGAGDDWQVHIPTRGACPSIYAAGYLPLASGQTLRFAPGLGAQPLDLPAGEWRFVFETGTRSRTIGEERLYSNVFTVE